MAKKKTKAKALTNIPQSREEAVRAIGRIGELRRDIAHKKSVIDEVIRMAGEKLEADVAPLLEELEGHEKGVQVWCAANRQALTNDGKVKFHDFGTGRVTWRLRPRKVTIRGAEAVIEACRSLGLRRFLRVSTEINKEAMLADPEKAAQINGVTISSEGEDFGIEPMEIEGDFKTAGAA